MLENTKAAVEQARISLTRVEPGHRRINDPLLQRRYQQAAQEREQARQRAIESYASELLPAILGGVWKAITWHSNLRFGYPVFDQPLAFRRKGLKGPLRWTSGVVLGGEPYDIVLDDGGLDPDFCEDLDTCGWQSNFWWGGGVYPRVFWISKDLSQHCPGQTSLILTGPDFESLGTNPADFGFIAYERKNRKARAG
jgi:hypothetical protein